MKTLILCFVALIQASAIEAQDRNSIELKLEPKDLKNGVPQAFEFRFVNVSDHDVRLPRPTVQCSDSFNGSVSVQVKFKPAQPKKDGELGYGCVCDSIWDSDVLRRAAKWKIVGPGESLVLTMRHDQLHRDVTERGRYEFWAAYEPAYVADIDRDLLLGSGIDFPHAPLTSNHLWFDNTTDAESVPDR